MRTARIILTSALIAFSIAGAAYAQETLKGEVATVTKHLGKLASS